MQLLVLGMHRSGTSAVTGLLTMMGAYFGPDDQRMGATEANPKGYWERQDVNTALESMLHAAGAYWWRVADFVTAKVPSQAREASVSEFHAIVREMDEHGPWVLKDPRTCLVLPLLRPLLTSPVAIVVHRDPIEIAMSLQRRDGFPLAAGVALWERYMGSALEGSADMPRISVRYSDVIEDPRAAAQSLERALAKLGVEGLRVPDDDVLHELVTPSLYRNRADAQAGAEYLNAWQAELAAALEDGTALERPMRPMSTGGLETLRMFELARRAESDLPAVRDGSDSAAALESALIDAQATVDELRRRSDALTLKLEDARSARREARRKLQEERKRADRARRSRDRALRERKRVSARHRRLVRRRSVRFALALSRVAQRVRTTRKRA